MNAQPMSAAVVDDFGERQKRALSDGRKKGYKANADRARTNRQKLRLYAANRKANHEYLTLDELVIDTFKWAKSPEGVRMGHTKFYRLRTILAELSKIYEPRKRQDTKSARQRTKTGRGAE